MEIYPRRAEMSRNNLQDIVKNMIKNPPTPNISMGYRLYYFLQKKFPEAESQLALSRKFGFPNSTVITWQNNESPIPPNALIKLIELGCDIEWLLTGIHKDEGVGAPSLDDDKPVTFKQTAPDAGPRAAETAEREQQLKRFGEALSRLLILSSKIYSGQMDLAGVERVGRMLEMLLLESEEREPQSHKGAGEGGRKMGK